MMHASAKANRPVSSCRRFAGQRQLVVNLVVVVCLLVFVAYLPVLSARAIFIDDDQYLTNNILVQRPSWGSVKKFFREVSAPSTVRGYYQPLTMTSLMLDYAIAKHPFNLRPFHRTNLVLHLANTALVTMLLYSLFGRPWIAAGVGLLFGLHPMTVESVAWISDRKTLLASFFAFGSLVFYTAFARRGGWRLGTACFTGYVLALLSKPTSLPLPLVMVLMDYWPLRRWKVTWRLLWEKLPLFVIGAVFAVITFLSQKATAGVTLPSQYQRWHVLLVGCHNIVFYLYTMFWPARISAYYDLPRTVTLSSPMVLAGVVGACGLFTLLLVSLRWTRALLTGWLIFFVAIFPAIGVVGFTAVIAANRYAYLPSIGILMMLASFLGWLCDSHGRPRFSWYWVPLAATVVMIAGAETVVTRRCLRHWGNTLTLYQHALTVSPEAAALHNNLGIALQALGRFDEAIGHYRDALRDRPNHYRAWNNLGYALQSQGKIDEAIAHYQASLRINRHYVKAHNNMAAALARKGQFTQAFKHLEAAARVDSYAPPAFQEIAWRLATEPDPNTRDADKALDLCRRARTLNLLGYENVQVLDTMAVAYAAKGDFDSAVETAKGAIELAVRMKHGEWAGQIEKRLRLYQERKPYRAIPEEASVAHLEVDAPTANGHDSVER